MSKEKSTKERTVPKVYSPDITPYSFEGRSYFFGTLLSIIVAPIRIISRVMHNIFVLPADLQEGYAQSLLIVSCVLLCIGVVDLFMFRKWPLLVSQIPAIFYSLRLKRQARMSQRIALEVRKIEIDEEEVEKAAGAVYDELKTILEDEK